MKACDQLDHLAPNLHYKNALVGRCWRKFDFPASLNKLAENQWNAKAARSIQVQMEQIRCPLKALI